MKNLLPHFLCHAMLAVSVPMLAGWTFAQDNVGTFIEPQITPIKGGYYLEWPQLTEISLIQLNGPLAGRVEIQFDVRQEDAGTKPQPVSDIGIMQVLADYWIMRGKPERAIPMYRKGLAQEPNNLVFLNNLAMLLSSVENKHAEALGLIDSALTKHHDNVGLLDTKGLILMRDGRPDEALPNLQRAVELSCQNPIFCMHLSKALDSSGQENAARSWFDKARPLLEASPNILANDNKDMFDELRGKFSPAVNL